jgi:hypothetical protein
VANKDRYTADEVAKEINDAKGFISVAAKRLGCSHQTVRNYAVKYETCKQAVFDAKEEMKDLAEGKLYQNINKNDTTSIIFFLKTQAKDRGYVERQEFDHTHQIIDVNWEDGKTDDGNQD